MDSSTSSLQFDIFHIYRLYSEIKSGKGYSCWEAENSYSNDSEKAKSSRETMSQLSKIVDSSFSMRVSILDELQKLMASLKTMGDFSEFSKFYDFVFFMCRENGQKNITVSRAIGAWKLTLAGRFRLLNQFCGFVEENHRYNISEDTWHQVLAFSRCVHEDLEGYDPEGAWPTLIDDFVEHMYRITGSNDGSSHNLTCHCGDPEDDSSVYEEPLPGLKELPGFKRKYRDDLQGIGISINSSLPSDVINSIVNLKRRKQQSQRKYVRGGEGNASNEELTTVKVNSPLFSSKSPCAVEGCLSKGFSGLFSAPRLRN
ncbi:defective in cullin neddylation protein AAR3 [Silene latifolia]|uniref:defective in cullin neddylation protein AAR3 n=1 Tax=Silene latifolia TaxID=37657 RepID=UPI003D76AD70